MNENPKPYEMGILDRQSDADTLDKLVQNCTPARQSPATEPTNSEQPTGAGSWSHLRLRHIDTYRDAFLDIGKAYAWNADRHFKYTYVHPSVEKVLGFTVDDMLGKNALEGVADYASAQIRHIVSFDSFAEVRDCSSANQVLTFDAQRYHKNGSCRNLRVSVTVLRDTDGRPIGTIGASWDATDGENPETVSSNNRTTLQDAIAERSVAFMRISEELKMEAARRSRVEAELKETEKLHESENRFRSVFEAAEDAIFMKDRDRKYSHANPAMLRLLGMAEKDIIGKTHEEVFEPRSSASLKELEERVLSGESIETEQTISTALGPITLNILRFPVLTKSGEVMGMCGIARDVTPRRAVYVRSRRDLDAYPSQVMRHLSNQLRSAAESDTTILFLGESGTGKDYLARYLHDKSWCSGGPFMSINCAALSPQLVESELFGHEHGAFTGAIRRKRGLLELAEGGTIFLNEIAELLQPLQAKLLTFLDTRSFARVGGEQSLTVNARIVAATNKDLKKEVLAGVFRKDLYFRLNVFPITVPPLRERFEDLDLLVKHIIADLMNKITILEPPYITTAAIEKLRKYSWPGNIRELRNVLACAVIMSDKKRITRSDIKIIPDGHVPISVEDTLTTQLVLDDGSSLQQTLRTGEKTLIQKALQLCAGNVTQAARRIGLTREQLKYRMRSLGIVRRGNPTLRG